MKRFCIKNADNRNALMREVLEITKGLELTDEYPDLEYWLTVSALGRLAECASAAAEQSVKSACVEHLIGQKMDMLPQAS